jgi:hypothetical protein
MIHNVFIMNRDGRIAFHRQYWSVDITTEIRQEFISTYKHFEKDLGPTVDLPIHVKNNKFLYTDLGTNLLLVFAVDTSDEDETIREYLKKTRELLITKYSHEIDSYIQTPVPLGQAFQEFSKELDNVIVTMLKICLLGQGGVGKSTMLKLLTADSIPGEYYPTIAVDIDAVLLVTDSTLKNVLETRDILEIVRKNAPSSIVWSIANKQDLPGALAPKLVQRILGVQSYGLVAIDPRYREVLYKIILGAVAEATTD